MNIPLLSFCLFLLWFGVAITVLLIGPLASPETFKNMKFVGIGAALLAVWNFVKWWGLRQYERARAYHREMEEAYRQRIKPTEEKKERQIVCPEFRFEDDEPTASPPPNESAGK
jgi:type VI protein secretion system component VasK